MSNRNSKKSNTILPDRSSDFEQIPFSAEDDVPIDDELKVVWQAKLRAKRAAREVKAALGYEDDGASEVKYNDYEAGVSRLDEEISANPQSGQLFIARGDLHCASGAYQLAVQDYARALLAEAGMYVERGQYTRALELYTQATRLAPDQAEVYAERSVGYIKSGEYQQALTDLTRAIELTSARTA